MICFDLLIPFRLGYPQSTVSGWMPKADLLPEALEAADSYDQEVSSSLTRASVFGRNPFSTVQHQAAAEQEFTWHYSDISELFDSAVNNELAYFQNGTMDLIDIVRRHA